MLSDSLQLSPFAPNPVPRVHLPNWDDPPSNQNRPLNRLSSDHKGEFIRGVVMNVSPPMVVVNKCRRVEREIDAM